MIEEISMMQEITNAIDEMTEIGMDRRCYVLFLSKSAYESLRREVQAAPWGMNPPTWERFFRSCMLGEDAMRFDGVRCLPAASADGFCFVMKEFIKYKFF